MIKKRYLFLIIIFCIFTVSAASAAEIDNKSNSMANDYDSTLITESVNENALSESYGTFQELQDEIDAVEDGGTLNLTRNYIYVDGSTDGVDIYRTITINGNGFYLDGCDQSRILDISASNVVLYNITLVNGNANDGGGISWNGINGTIKYVKFYNNVALEDGGAVNAHGDILNIQYCNFTNNEANTGGAIYCYDTKLKIKDTYFIKNIGWDRGGAIHCRGPDSEVDNCTFIKNEGHTSGAINFDRPNCIVNNSLFIENIAYRYGGAFWWIGTQGILNNSIFINNKASESGKAISWDGAKGILQNLIYYYSDTLSIRVNNTLINCTEIYNTYPYWRYIVENNDLTKYYNESTNFTVRILKSEGGYAGNNEKVNFIINDNYYEEYTDLNGYTQLNERLQPGNYIVTTDYGGNNVNNTIEILPTLFDKDMNISSTDISEVETEVINVILPKDATGTVSTIINNIEYSSNINDGVGNIIITDLYPDYYNIEVIYSGDYQYNTLKGNTSFMVNRYINLYAPNVTKYFMGSERFVVTLTDSVGNPLPNQNIYITINGATYSRTTNSEGTSSIAINLASDEYDVIVNYEDFNVTSKITILPTILGNDVVKMYKNNTQYYAIFLDSEGNYLPKGTAVMFNLNGIFYSQEIMDNKGTARLNIDEKPGIYILTASNPVTNEMLSNTITVISNIVENYNLTKYYNETATFSVKILSSDGKPASGEKVKFIIGNNIYESTTNSNAYAFLDTVLQPGKYIITTSYGDIEVNNTITILPTLYDKDMNVSSFNIDEGENEIITVVLPKDATGKVSTAVNNKEYSANLNKGIANINIPDLRHGTYNVDVNYSGDLKYNSLKGKTSFTVDSNIDMSVSDVIKYYGGSERLYLTLKNKNGQPIADAKVKININNVDYDRTTGADGKTSIALSIPAGNYTATVEYDGIKTTSNVVIRPTVSGNDITKIYKNATQYYAKFVDTKGNILKNTQVKFNINGVFYTRTTNENGIAKMNINLNPKEYIITATNPNSGEMHSNVVKVLSNIAENHDLTKYYKNASQYVIRLLDGSGKPVGAGKSVQFNINGVFYTRTSNATGHVKMNINLNPNTYIITANYNGLMTSNTIKVLSVLEAKDLAMKYRDGSKFEVTLLDGKGNPFAGQKITFNINGVFYDRTTDASGIARLNINLMAGDYIITSMYSNGAIISNRITIYENPDAGYVYIDLPSYDTTTTVQSGNYRIEAHQWRSPGLGELDIYVYDSNGNMLREYDYDSKISDGTRWSGTYSTYEYATYHKWQFSPDIRMTQIAVKIK